MSTEPLTPRQRAFRADLAKQQASLHHYAAALLRERGAVDDLVHDATVLALRHEAQFEPGTDMRAWLGTILRNRHYSAARRRRMGDAIYRALGAITAHDAGAPQEPIVMLHETAVRIEELAPDGAYALVHLALGYSQEDVARETGMPVGTVKSRASRARAHLKRLMEAPACCR